MKFKITFEIDASDTSYSIKNKNDEVAAVLQNLGSWFNRLHLANLERKFENMSREFQCGDLSSEQFKKAVLECDAEELKLSSQLFNNYKVEGTMENGKTFTFTHTDPGYVETMTFH